MLVQEEVSQKSAGDALGCLSEQLYLLHLQNWAEESKRCNFPHSLFQRLRNKNNMQQEGCDY